MKEKVLLLKIKQSKYSFWRNFILKTEAEVKEVYEYHK